MYTVGISYSNSCNKLKTSRPIGVGAVADLLQCCSFHISMLDHTRHENEHLLCKDRLVCKVEIALGCMLDV